jgi:hypothetical protein
MLQPIEALIRIGHCMNVFRVGHPIFSIFRDMQDFGLGLGVGIGVGFGVGFDV